MNITARTLACLLAACAAFTGCNQQPAVDDGRTSIGVILFQEDQYFRLVEFGMRDAAKKLDVDLMVNNSSGTLDKEISLIDTYLANKADALAVAPLSAKSSIAALRRAHERKIPVVTFDSFIEADFPVSNIRSDQVDLGRKTGEAARAFIEQKLGGKAKLGLVEYMSLAPEPASQRVQGFKDEVTKLPGVEIVTEQDAWLAPEATVLVENMLTANPDINIIWAANEGGTVGAVTAVVNKGKAGQIYVFGTDMSEQIGGFLLTQDNVLQAVTGQKPFDIGTAAITNAVKALKGEPVEAKVALPGLLFTRDLPQDVEAYVQQLKELTK